MDAKSVNKHSDLRIVNLDSTAKTLVDSARPGTCVVNDASHLVFE